MAFRDKFQIFHNLQVNDNIELRQVDPERDLPAYNRLLSDSEAFRYYSGYNHAPKDAKGILDNMIKEFQKMRVYRWTIAERASDTAIGCIHFWDFQYNNTAANIGYWLGREYWGRGIITACIKPVVQFGFDYLQLERIFTTVQVENIGSWRALEKNGFLREGTLRHCFQTNSGLHDCYMYAKLYTD